MNVGYIIICRYNSTRLPGKILKTIKGMPLLKIITDRLEVLGKENIVIATSEENTDDPIAEWCNNNNIKVFRGSLYNVAQRFLQAAKWGGFEYAVRVNGDNLFADGNLIKSLAETAANENLDFLSNVPGRTFPTGMSIEVVKTSFYEKLYNDFDEEKYFEHVTLYLYEHPDEKRSSKFITNNEAPQAKGLKMAIDTIDDFKQAEKIMEALGEEYRTAGWKEIVQLKNEII